MENSSPAIVKLFIGGLPPRTHKDILKKKFIEGFAIVNEDFKNSISVNIKLGYGFVSFPQSFFPQIENEIASTKIIIQEKLLEFSLAVSRKEARQKIEEQRDKKLYVGNITPDITGDNLKAYFSQFGELEFAN